VGERKFLKTRGVSLMALGKRTSSFLKEGSLASGFAVGIVINFS
jgi:hypothetical protein